jgi:hypothetical protein
MLASSMTLLYLRSDLLPSRNVRVRTPRTSWTSVSQLLMLSKERASEGIRVEVLERSKIIRAAIESLR